MPAKEKNPSSQSSHSVWSPVSNLPAGHLLHSSTFFAPCALVVPGAHGTQPVPPLLA